MKKKATKPNPLKVFNDNKAMAYKKAGGAMKDFKKSLKRAQEGTEMNDDLINKSGYGALKKDNAKLYQNPYTTNTTDAQHLDVQKMEEELRRLNAQYPNWKMAPNGGLIPVFKQKRGGAIKSKKK